VKQGVVGYEEEREDDGSEESREWRWVKQMLDVDVPWLNPEPDV
jgi:hypothetical protein